LCPFYQMGGDMDDITIGNTASCFLEHVQSFLIKETHARTVHDFQTGCVEGLDLVRIQDPVPAGAKSPRLIARMDGIIHIIHLQQPFQVWLARRGDWENYDKVL